MTNMGGNQKMNKFKSFASTSKKVAVLLSVSALSISILCSCGKKEEVSTTAVNEITENTSEETMLSEITEPETEEEITDDEVSEISDEYLADYPLQNGSVSVFIKLPDGLDYYPDAIIDSVNTSCKDDYDNYNSIILRTSYVNYEDGYRNINVYYSLNPEINIDWYIENKDLGWNNGQYERFEIVEPETLANGIIINKIEAVQIDSGELITTMYLLTYSIDESNTIQVEFSDATVEDQAERVLDFYRTEENPFYIMDYNTTTIE